MRSGQTEAIPQRCSLKKVFLKVFRKIQRKIPEQFRYWKDTPARVLSRLFWKVFKNAFFIEYYLRVTASEQNEENHQMINGLVQGKKITKKFQEQPPEVLYKKFVLDILQNSKENACAKVWLLF